MSSMSSSTFDVLDDPSILLPDVFDIIDGSESDLSPNDSLASESDSVAGDAVHVEMVRTEEKPQQKPAPATRQKTKKSSRRKQGPVPYTTELQRRKRSELLTLRQEAVKLNELLVQLHQRRHDRLAISADGTGEGGNGWRNLAAIASEERQRAERINRELKTIMTNQQKTWTAIQKLLGKRGVREGREFVFQLKPALDRFPSRIDFSDAVLGELASGLEALRLDAGMMFPTLDATNCSIVSHSQDKHHATNGHRIAETTTTTPLACSMKGAADLFWLFCTTDCDTSFHSLRKTNPHLFEMNCVASSRDGPQNVDGVVLYRKYDESNRCVIVGSSTWFLPTGGVEFEDRIWTVITPSPSDPLHASVVHTRYQLQAKITDASVLSTDFAYVETAVMSSIGRKLRLAMQALQDMLINEVDKLQC